MCFIGIFVLLLGIDIVYLLLYNYFMSGTLAEAYAPRYLYCRRHISSQQNSAFIALYRDLLWLEASYLDIFIDW